MVLVVGSHESRVCMVALLDCFFHVYRAVDELDEAVRHLQVFLFGQCPFQLLHVADDMAVAIGQKVQVLGINHGEVSTVVVECRRYGRQSFHEGVHQGGDTRWE